MAENVSKRFGIFPGRARGVQVELKDNAPRVYVYEDENIRLKVPVPLIDVFLAFVRELDKLGGEDADVEKYVTTLARAFWLLHQRPKRWELPELDDEAAFKLFKEKVRWADVTVKSLAPAMFGLVEYVMRNGDKDLGFD